MYSLSVLETYFIFRLLFSQMSDTTSSSSAANDAKDKAKNANNSKKPTLSAKEQKEKLAAKMAEAKEKRLNKSYKDDDKKIVVGKTVKVDPIGIQLVEWSDLMFDKD